MTPTKLEALVLAGNLDRLADGLATLTEKERKSLSTTAAKLERQIRTGKLAPDASNGVIAAAKKFERAWRQANETSPHRAAEIAVIGVGPLSAAKRLRLWIFEKPVEDVLVRVLSDRRPEWIDAWIEHRLEQEFSGLSWGGVRTMVRNGVCRRPDGDGYIRLMVNGIGGWYRNEREQKRSEAFLRDPELLENEIWRLFEVDTNAFTSDWMEQGPHIPEGYESWPTTVVALAEGGHLDRERLLTATLDGLSSGLPQNILSGFHKLHVRLDPSLEEIQEREHTYRDLLQNQVPHVVGFALRMLRDLEKKRVLDGASFLAAAAPVFSLETKGPASNVLKMAKRLATREKALIPSVLALAAESLTHSAADVQAAGLDLLSQWQDDLDDAEKSALAAKRGFLGPALQSKLDEILGRAPEAPADAASSVKLELPPPFERAVMETRFLERADPIEPIVSVDELIDRLSRAAEVLESADELECLLDGLSRLCDQRPERFASRTAPLLKRLQKASDYATDGMVDAWSGVPVLLKDLLISWLTGKKHRTKAFDWYTQAKPFALLTSRIEELRDRVVDGHAAQLLAAPTHARGWIDARVVVERLKESPEPPKWDFIQAMLRMAPDARAEALETARDLEGPHGRWLRWALGGGDGPKRGESADYPFWIAASRSRGPLADWRDALAPLELDDTLADATEPAAYQWRTHVRKNKSFGTTYTFPELLVNVRGQEPEVPTKKGRLAASTNPLIQKAKSVLGGHTLTDWREVPTAALHLASATGWTSDFQYPWLIRWLATTWPLNTDSVLATGARFLAPRLDDNSAATTVHHAFLEPLFEAERTWTEMAYLLIVIALISKDADIRGLAIDALIEAIEDGRAHPDPLARVATRLSDGGWVKSNRLAEAMTVVSSPSDVHGLVVVHFLDAFWAGVASAPKASHHLLELHVALAIQLGAASSERARQTLESFRGSGKAAKLAKRLLAEG